MEESSCREAVRGKQLEGKSKVEGNEEGGSGRVGDGEGSRRREMRRKEVGGKVVEGSD